MSKVIFTGKFGMRSGSKNEYVDDIPAKVRELLAKGVRIDVKGSASTVRPLLTELMFFPLPEEEDEPKTVIRYGLEIGGGMRSFETKPQAVAYHKRYGRGSVLNIQEVEVQV